MRFFLYRLSVQMGRFVHEIEQELDGSQIAEYMAYDQIEPFGEQRDDARSASICATMANMWRGKGGRRRAIQDFMLFAQKPAKRSPEELLIMVKAVHESVKKRHGSD